MMKRRMMLSVLTAAAMMLSAQLHVFAGSVGDLDSNGAVDAVDASAMLLRAAEIGTGGTADADETVLMDINGDGAITAVDASHLLTYAARFGTGETTQPFEEYVALRQEEPVLYDSFTEYNFNIFSDMFIEFESSRETGHVITTASELEAFVERLDRCGLSLGKSYDAEWFETHSLFVMLTYEFSTQPWYEATAITKDENNNWTVAITQYDYTFESPMCVDKVTVVETNKAIEFAASVSIDMTYVTLEGWPESE